MYQAEELEQDGAIQQIQELGHAETVLLRAGASSSIAPDEAPSPLTHPSEQRCLPPHRGEHQSPSDLPMVLASFLQPRLPASAVPRPARAAPASPRGLAAAAAQGLMSLFDVSTQ